MAHFEYVGTELDVFALATNWKRYFAALLRPYLRGAVLEVGAGIGETTRALWGPQCSRWLCLEPDAGLAERLRTLVLDGEVQPEIVVGDVRTLSPEPVFDAIVYIDVLEHIRDDVGELKEASRRLAPGGYLVVLSPAFQSLYSSFDKAIGHERRYSRRSLRAVFPSELMHVASFYADALGAALSFGNALLLKQSMPKRRQILFWDRVVIPISRLIDPLVGRSFGRSVIAVYQKPAEAIGSPAATRA